MRQSVVAVNFADLLQLKQATGKILDGLLHIPSEDKDVSIAFRVVGVQWGVVVESNNSKQQYGFPNAPQGISVEDWANLVSVELRNLLLSGSQFVFEGTQENVMRMSLDMYLKRT